MEKHEICEIYKKMGYQKIATDLLKETDEKTINAYIDLLLFKLGVN